MVLTYENVIAMIERDDYKDFQFEYNGRQYRAEYFVQTGGEKECKCVSLTSPQSSVYFSVITMRGFAMKELARQLARSQEALAAASNVIENVFYDEKPGDVRIYAFVGTGGNIYPHDDVRNRVRNNLLHYRRLIHEEVNADANSN